MALFLVLIFVGTGVLFAVFSDSDESVTDVKIPQDDFRPTRSTKRHIDSMDFEMYETGNSFVTSTGDDLCPDCIDVE